MPQDSGSSGAGTPLLCAASGSLASHTACPSSLPRSPASPALETVAAAPPESAVAQGGDHLCRPTFPHSGQGFRCSLPPLELSSCARWETLGNGLCISFLLLRNKYRLCGLKQRIILRSWRSEV